MDREYRAPGAKDVSCRRDALKGDECGALADGGSRIGWGRGCAGQSSCETAGVAGDPPGGFGGAECGADSAQEEQRSTGDGRRDAVLRAREGDEEAFAEAVVENLPLVAHIAKRFSRAEAEYEDLFQSGCIGLMKAVRRYEPGFGTAFSTYAVPVIMGEMRRLLRDGGQVHVARSIREKAALIAKCEEELTAQTGSAPTFAQISEKTGLTKEEIALSYGARRPLISLDAPAPGMENVTNGELIPGGEVAGIEEGIVLRQLLGALEEQDRRLIELRYKAGKTQTETGEILGMTQVQVCRREKKLLRQMREASGGG